MKFKVGNKVSLSEQGMIVHKNTSKSYNLHEMEGIITKVRINLGYPIYVKWDKHLNSEYCYCESELEFTNEPIMDVDDLFEDIEL